MRGLPPPCPANAPAQMLLSISQLGCRSCSCVHLRALVVASLCRNVVGILLGWVGARVSRTPRHLRSHMAAAAGFGACRHKQLVACKRQPAALQQIRMLQQRLPGHLECL